MNHIKATYAGAVLIFLCASWLVTDTAYAHRVNVFAWVDGDRIIGKGKFAGGRPLRSAKLTVLGSDGTELYEGLTNQQGEFSFKIPQQTDLRIVVNAGPGHRGEWVIRAADIAAGSIDASAQTPPIAVDQPPSGKDDAVASEKHRQSTHVSALTRAELEAIITSAVERKLKPITEILTRMQNEQPGLKDVLAGVGYIFGLVGVVAYLSSRRKKG
jgi:nickel transport protein